MVVEPDICSHFYIESVYIKKSLYTVTSTLLPCIVMCMVNTCKVYTFYRCPSFHCNFNVHICSALLGVFSITINIYHQTFMIRRRFKLQMIKIRRYSAEIISSHFASPPLSYSMSCNTNIIVSFFSLFYCYYCYYYNN